MAAAMPTLRRVYTLGDGLPSAAPFPTPGEAPGLAPADHNPDKVTYLAFTSGTTGMPKGVMHSDNTLLANARAMVEDWHHDERTVLLSLSPLSHHIAAVAIAQALAAGMELVVNDPAGDMSPLGLDPRNRRDLCDGRADACDGHPRRIAGRRRMDGLGRVKVFYMAGSADPREVAQAFLDRGVIPQNVYGMSGEQLAPIHPAERPGETIVATRGSAAPMKSAVDQENPDIEVMPAKSARSAAVVRA
jgi:acyl-CoA synthetase